MQLIEQKFRINIKDGDKSKPVIVELTRDGDIGGISIYEASMENHEEILDLELHAEDIRQIVRVLKDSPYIFSEDNKCYNDKY